MKTYSMLESFHRSGIVVITEFFNNFIVLGRELLLPGVIHHNPGIQVLSHPYLIADPGCPV